MSTQIWSANIVIGGDSNQVILDKVAIKRLPISVLMSDTHFVKTLKLKLGGDGADKMTKGEKVWDKLPKNKITGQPNIKVFYLKHLGEVAQDPILDYFCDLT